MSDLSRTADLGVTADKDGLRPPCGEGWKTEAGELLGLVRGSH